MAPFKTLDYKILTWIIFKRWVIMKSILGQKNDKSKTKCQGK